MTDMFTEGVQRIRISEKQLSPAQAERFDALRKEIERDLAASRERRRRVPTRGRTRPRSQPA